MDFLERYRKLNSAQKLAVDTIDGPVMVIAGPGTGKTELLSVRAANILQKTDTLPESILCLTFTESGASAMRKRLTDIIGKEAYKVAIHTFHSFGGEVISQNNEYFYHSDNFRPADTLSSYEILRSIFDELKLNNPLAIKQNGEYSYLRESAKVISEIKRSGLTNDELLNILDQNDITIEKVEQLLSPIFDGRLTPKVIEQLAGQIETIQNIDDINNLAMASLSDIVADSLKNAVEQASETGKTPPIRAWRDKWFEKDDTGKFVLKSKKRQIKLRTICYIYGQYLSKMQEAELYDFDDMILRVVHAMEVFDDLRFNLQEKYQYIMVDEFQDTNMAQMRIIHNLTNNLAHGDTPNILVVGDDDQAIYSFQGAEISNILNFETHYPRAKRIVLTENYRSTADVLTNSRRVIIQGNERLENSIEGLDKQLSANVNYDQKSVNYFELDTIDDERKWIASDIKKRLQSGEEPNEITVLARKHNELIELLPYLYREGIAVNYERHDSVLELAPIKFIEQLAKVLIDIYKGDHDNANSALPELLAHKIWQIKPLDLWKLSLKAHKNHSDWLELMGETPEFSTIQNWLIKTAMLVETINLEEMLDIIIGKPKPDEQPDAFRCPFYDYYFSENQLGENPDQYLNYLEALRVIRDKLREYHPNQNASLITFVEFIDLNRKISAAINISKKAGQLSEAVNLMTAHSSKGLEFDTVYIVNAVDKVWGESARGNYSSIGYPENLPLAPAGEQQDERLRLFYVAMTRAKKNLNISYSLSDYGKKNTLKASFLVDESVSPIKIESNDNIETLTKNAEIAWYQPLVEPITPTMHDLLAPDLENYKLSATHLNNFLDVSRGGPAKFLTNNLLRFPQAKTASSTFGTVVHGVLQRAHNFVIASGKKQAIEDILAEFENALKKEHMNTQDHEKYLQKGSDTLRLFLDEKYASFNQDQRTEVNFSYQQAIVGEAHLTGNIDLIDINKADKTILVTDYKTGSPAMKWTGKSDYEKIKLHNYKQQLIFYKLLIENGRDYRDYRVEGGIMQFVEPTRSGQIVALEDCLSDDDVERLTKLINVVWQHIKELNLPDTSHYEPTLKGILQFENDLLDSII